MSYEIQATVNVPAERIADCLTNALECGSTYWCGGIRIIGKLPEGCEFASEAIAVGSRFLFDIIGDSKNCAPGQKVEDALRIMAERYPRHFGDLMGETDDAETADVLFQLICFGEVVFG